MQRHTKALTSYVQTVRDLGVTPFFGQGHPGPIVNFIHDTKNKIVRIDYKLADPNVLRATLVSLRKLISKREPSFYPHVANILRRYHAQVGWYVDFLQERFKSSCDSTSAWKVAAPDKTNNKDELLAAGKVLKLWMNARSFHSGIPGESESDAKDFDRERQRIGAARTNN